MYGVFGLIAFVFAVASAPAEVDDRVCKIYDGENNPSCTTTFNDDPESIAQFGAFKEKVISICKGTDGTSLEFGDDTRTIKSVLPNEVFASMILDGNEKFISTACIL
ncbi:hypothetical protein DSO57_1023165 [Entomophthora muscae]|uniref:Uncharacterized protein n=1 Tax=Entomophthora muscae TaxID=34485 RepID=A0ACC2TRA4_9FUNG|nr:hypothetical protein DSO57_1023165 [Entomophthora muscae]